MKIIYIKLRNCSQTCYVDVNDAQVEPNTAYIIETEQGIDIGNTCGYLKYLNESEIEKTGKILRAATEDDLNKLPDIIALENKAFKVCRKKIIEKKLEMKLVSVKSYFDKTKIIFYFVAENRIDFRELVRDLAAVFRTRIEMRQIGVRDETKMIGGFGLCGRQLCCGFLNDGFEPVSIKMAKEQNLNLNSLKISGMCGRLLCCLGYEYDTYKDLNKELPLIDSEIKAGDKFYKVISIDTLKGKIRLKHDSLIVEVSSSDLQRKDNRFFIAEEVIQKLTEPYSKDNHESLEIQEVVSSQ
ncbi:MAG: stage 0 sporulation protein [Spirochaetes bacterium]|nr:stage 0 sporulation protein [Spirochaetota bacterium]